MGLVGILKGIGNVNVIWFVYVTMVVMAGVLRKGLVLGIL